MHWLYLVLAICFEVLGTLSLKFSSLQGGKLWVVAIAFFYLASFSFVWLAIKVIDIGVAYAVWAGMGTALIALFGWLVFKEEMSPAKAFFILMIIVGVAGLKFLSDAPEVKV